MRNRTKLFGTTALTLLIAAAVACSPSPAGIGVSEEKRSGPTNLSDGSKISAAPETMPLDARAMPLDARAMPPARAEAPPSMEVAAMPAYRGTDTADSDFETGVPDLTAGEVDDNQRWDEYLSYRREYAGPPVHDVDVSERYIVTVRDSRQRPIPNATVRISALPDLPLFEGRTYADGRTLFFPKSFPAAEQASAFRLYAEADGASKSVEFERGAAQEWTASLELEWSPPETAPLDILFLLDATGSMADEIHQIKTTLQSMAARIGDLPAQPDLRFGMVAYRDRGDAYITRTFPFTSDIPAFAESIRGVHASGGNDTPESLNAGLHAAIQEPDWRTKDAVRLVFLVGDAPPHLDYPQDYDYAVEMAEAKRRGIKIFAIASSGLDDQGEYIYRQIAQHTMGRFIFLIYQGPQGEAYTPHHVEQYSVEQLDTLLVRLVQEELAHLSEQTRHP